MKSKEALENIKSRINSLSLFPKVDRKTYDESWEKIEKDLEILELIKERLIHNIMGNIVFVDNLKLTERKDENGKIIYIDEDKYKIMRWLDNEKTN